ncbi:hypothetical protein INT48_003275 [Thamnidium elegans]|uniref:Uncharacterized protein n=1 Tax=Thamnidium elegans TaxID=101142 RepID=A0A8H7W2U7_9FUNG|nr:hypothetical protein INT48_003275 [Thamnidium elegans]
MSYPPHPPQPYYAPPPPQDLQQGHYQAPQGGYNAPSQPYYQPQPPPQTVFVQQQPQQKDDTGCCCACRLSLDHQQLLNAALAHIRLAYVANRTPHYSTPPLLVLYTVRKDNQQKPLDQRLLDIVNAYFFSMLQPGSAFAYDMLWPVKIEWFFTSLPNYMSMNTDQAAFYKERTEPHQYRFESTPNYDLLEKSFTDHYSSQGIKIVSTTNWSDTAWMVMRENPSMRYARDRYRLNHLPQKSDWFWIASQLLFSRPEGGWFSQQLEGYRDIMGGRLELSESLSLWDPQSKRVTPELASKHWLRIGIRVTSIQEQELECLVDHVVNICQQSQASCHVFISASNRLLLKSIRNKLNIHQIAVHAVAEGFGFADLNDLPENNLDHSIFDTDENRLKRDYARTFMDWIILSRMDYLVGQHDDGFLKTAAWAAQCINL